MSFDTPLQDGDNHAKRPFYFDYSREVSESPLHSEAIEATYGEVATPLAIAGTSALAGTAIGGAQGLLTDASKWFPQQLLQTVAQEIGLIRPGTVPFELTKTKALASRGAVIGAAVGAVGAAAYYGVQKFGAETR